MIIVDPQVNPEPNAAKTTKSLSLIKLSLKASAKAIGIEAAVVLPYLCILENTFLVSKFNFFVSFELFLYLLDEESISQYHLY